MRSLCTTAREQPLLSAARESSHTHSTADPAEPKKKKKKINITFLNYTLFSK